MTKAEEVQPLEKTDVVLVEQETSRPTRKVTAGTIGALAGGIIGQALSAWAQDLSGLCLGTNTFCLSFLANETARDLFVAIAAMAGSFIAGYLSRERRIEK